MSGDTYRGTGRVVSLGSINIDKTRKVSESETAEFEERYDWFPDRGQTVRVEDAPDEFSAPPDSVLHGGKGANQTVAAAKAGAGTAMLGKVGSDHDEFGVLESLEENGVDTDGVGTASEPTGTAHVFVGPDGDNRIVVYPGANGAVDRRYIRSRYETILEADCLLLQNEIPPEPVVALLSDLADESNPPTVVLDPAPSEGAEELLVPGAVDYLTPNENEYESLRSHLDGFDGVVVRKRGGDDVIVEDGESFSVEPPQVRAVDTTGAGDVLNGFMAARLAAGASLREAVEVGAVAGSMSTREEGARGGIPTLEEVRAFRDSEGIGDS